MKLSSKTVSAFLVFVGLGFLIGSLAWEVLERVLARLNVELGLVAVPVGLDLSALKLYVQVNPGTFVGLLGGIVLFRVL